MSTFQSETPPTQLSHPASKCSSCFTAAGTGTGPKAGAAGTTAVTVGSGVTSGAAVAAASTLRNGTRGTNNSSRATNGELPTCGDGFVVWGFTDKWNKCEPLRRAKPARVWESPVDLRW